MSQEVARSILYVTRGSIKCVTKGSILYVTRGSIQDVTKGSMMYITRGSTQDVPMAAYCMSQEIAYSSTSQQHNNTAKTIRARNTWCAKFKKTFRSGSRRAVSLPCTFDSRIHPQGGSAKMAWG